MAEEKRFEEESARAITGEIITFTRTSQLNRMPDDENRIIFDRPLVKFADGDNPVFAEFKTIIGPAHLTPREVLAQAYEKSPDELPDAFR